ncbi:MAG: hypothetical protein MSA77_07940 [Selenomonadales bacterium]|nr:hypothetical protein [Selenomonadales bacterium]
MSDYNVMDQILRILRKKWIPIIIIGMLFSFVFMGFKYSTKDSYTLAPNGDVLISDVIRIDDYIDRYDILRYDKYLNSSVFLYSFYENTKDSYDYNKLSPGWDSKTNSQKQEWMTTHIKTEYYGAGRIAVSLDLKKSDPMDLEYVKEHGADYIKSLIAFADSKDSFGKYEVVNSVVSIPESLTTSNKKVVLRYGIIGFILGAVVMTTIVIIWYMRKGYDGKY